MLPDAIQWHEGMLLVPQHFQQMALRQEALLHYHMGVASPFHWGVRRFAHDAVLLAGGLFRVREIEAVLPDGLLVSLTGEDSEDLELDLAPLIDQMREGPITIHLAVAARRPSAAAQNGAQTRYRSVPGEDVVDENTGDGWVQIPRLRPRLTLVAGDAPSSRYCTLPIARVTYGSDLFTLTDYIPPTLAVPVRSEIGAICSRIARMLREKGTFLAEELRTRHYDMGTSLVLDNRSKIQSLVEGLPALEANLHTGRSHPFTLYHSLCLIAGHVATLGSIPVPPVFAPYDHNDPRPAFDAVHDYIVRMIEEGIHETFLRLQFSFDDGAFFRTIDPSWLDDSSILIGVRGKGKVREKQVTAWMEEALIGSEPVIRSLRERRILGARRRVAQEGAAYITGSEMIPFEIDITPEFIRGGMPLQIVDMGDVANVVEEIVLFVPKNRERRASLQ